MIKLFLLALAAAAVLLPARAYASSPVLYDSASGERIEVEQLAERLTHAGTTIMFGEFHDQPSVHRVQAELFTAICARVNAYPVTLSMEMFERDTQVCIDDYLAGRSTEQEMLAHSRPWPRYATDYRPMVETARAHGHAVLASNVPRPYANQYMKTGSLEGLDALYMAEKTYAPEGGYQERFYDAMRENSASGMKVPPQMYAAMYRAQSLKDDTMAESIANVLAADPRTLIYHVQGEFHGSYHYGVAMKLQALRPTTKITVISPVFREAGKSDTMLVTENKSKGDYLLLID